MIISMANDIGPWKLNNTYCSDAIVFMMSLPTQSIDVILGARENGFWTYQG
jgi:hypothetical protein